MLMFAVSLVLLLLSTVLWVVTDGSEGLLEGSLYLLAGLSFAAMGALVSIRNPSNGEGWIMGVIGLLIAVAAAPPLGEAGGTAYELWAVFVITCGTLTLPLIGTYFLLLFPDGGLPSPRWRVVGVFDALTLAAVGIGTLLEPGPVENLGFDNPLGVPALSWLSAIGWLMVIAGIALSVVALVFRYRGADVTGRQQLKWLVFASVLLVLSIPVAWILSALGLGSFEGTAQGINWVGIIVNLGVVAVPLAAGIAILRYRLYDIDRIISRTVAYALVALVLVSVYSAVVLGIGVLVGRNEPIAVAIGTLAAAAIFAPVRRVLQTSVERRFNRSHYDTARTLEAFAGQLRDQVDLDDLVSDLTQVVNQTLHPASTTIWLAPSGERSASPAS
jgi:hypothetical protein